MFFPLYKLGFFFLLISSSMISISSSSWLGAWAGLEINLLSFIPLMKESSESFSSESSLKYFLVQALASSVMLFAVLLMSSTIMENLFFFLLLSALFMKIGVAPLHFWFPNVMEGLSWVSSSILMTWQKVAPLCLISYSNLNFFLTCGAILSAVMGAIGGMNQSSIRKIMAFSSVNHLSWILMAMIYSNKLWIMYFSFYCLMVLSLIVVLNKFNLFYINQMNSFHPYSPILKISIALSLLSLGGLPPFLGFFPKWMVIETMASLSFSFSMFILILMTLVTLFFYLRIFFSTLMLGSVELKWMSNLNFMSFSLIFLFLSTIGMGFVSSFFFIF